MSQSLSIALIHATLTLIADLLAGTAIVGLIIVVLFLFQGERGAAIVQINRR